MKIAVAYEDGTVFQHFGHTEQFKVYEIADGKVVSSGLLSADGTGHEALAGFLKERGIDVLICGGIGGGAVNALSQYGIRVAGGAEGPVEDVVRAYLKGKLVPRDGFMCAHHDHGAGHSCGDHGCVSHENDHSCGNGSCSH